MQFVICKPHATVCKAAIKICQYWEVSRVITQPEFGWCTHPSVTTFLWSWVIKPLPQNKGVIVIRMQIIRSKEDR
eukprot:5830320-Lingulodinium_polyedra.AAC.1